jgi:hypothetical protein
MIDLSGAGSTDREREQAREGRGLGRHVSGAAARPPRGLGKEK